MVEMLKKNFLKNILIVLFFFLPVLFFHSYHFLKSEYLKDKYRYIELTKNFSQKYEINDSVVIFIVKFYKDNIEETRIPFELSILVNGKKIITLNYLYDPKNPSYVFLGNFDDDKDKELYIRNFKKYENIIIDFDKKGSSTKELSENSEIVKYFNKHYMFLGNQSNELVFLGLFSMGIFLSIIFLIFIVFKPITINQNKNNEKNM